MSLLYVNYLKLLSSIIRQSVYLLVKHFLTCHAFLMWLSHKLSLFLEIACCDLSQQTSDVKETRVAINKSAISFLFQPTYGHLTPPAAIASLIDTLRGKKWNMIFNSPPLEPSVTYKSRHPLYPYKAYSNVSPSNLFTSNG